jgi:hypothetical protein
LPESVLKLIKEFAMKTISTIGLTLILILSSSSIAISKKRTPKIHRSPQPITIMAKHALSGYVHPKGVLSVREEVMDPDAAYRWRGVYQADPNYPPIKAQTDAGLISIGGNAVSAYCDQVRDSGIKIGTRQGDYCSYIFKDAQGKEWKAVARGDSDYHQPESGRFSVFIGVPGS